ncbi:MAG: hypothetical protein PHQ72_10275 [Hespellia sp.]|nr:hypothetical protein [Hespellia sp.]
MEKILSTVLPIILILGLGYYCKRKEILSDKGIEGIKTLSIKFLWPLVLFYAFFTASYGIETILYAGVNFATNAIAFAIGIFMRPRVKEHGFSYPYLLSGFETGMIGYAMFTLLFGAGNISYLALLDVGHALFIFPIFLSCLNMEQGQGTLRDSVKDMLKSTIMIALAIGMIAGLTGIGEVIMNSQAGMVIERIYNLASSANVVMILVVMGYNLSFSWKQVKESANVILVRMLIMVLCAVGSLWLIQIFVPLNVYLVSAVVVTYIMPPVYMLAVYVKDKKENEFMSTTTTIYTVLTIIAFLIMTIFVK